MEKHIALVLVCVAAITANAAGGPSGPVIRADGRIGSFRIDVTTEAQLRSLAGKPDRVENQFFPPSKTPVGRTLYYLCGRGCQTAYSISRSTGKLSNFWSTSRRFTTEHGSRVGMNATQAAEREGKRLVPGCGDALYLHLRWDVRRQFVLTVSRGAVLSIAYSGPNSVYYDGSC